MPRMNKTQGMNILPGKISYNILKWMQEHDNSLKKTTAHVIASRIAAMPEVENGELTIEQTLGKMVKCNIIYRDKHPGSYFSDFRINYWHKSIPADILADAPVDVKRAMAKTIDDMQPNQYMDDEGAVVTPNAVEKTEDPFNEDGEVDMHEKFGDAVKQLGFGGETIIPQAISGPWSDEDEEPTTQNVTVPLDIKKDGKQITVNLSLTINL